MRAADCSAAFDVPQQISFPTTLISTVEDPKEIVSHPECSEARPEAKRLPCLTSQKPLSLEGQEVTNRSVNSDRQKSKGMLCLLESPVERRIMISAAVPSLALLCKTVHNHVHPRSSYSGVPFNSVLIVVPVSTRKQASQISFSYRREVEASTDIQGSSFSLGMAS